MEKLIKKHLKAEVMNSPEFREIETMVSYEKLARIKNDERAQIAKCLHRAEKEVKEDIFNQRYMQNSHRCFAKFTIDILNR